MEEILLLKERRDLALSGFTINSNRADRLRRLMKYESNQATRFAYQNAAISAERLAASYESAYNQACAELGEVPVLSPTQAELAGYGTMISNQKPQ